MPSPSHSPASHSHTPSPHTTHHPPTAVVTDCRQEGSGPRTDLASCKQCATNHSKINIVSADRLIPTNQPTKILADESFDHLYPGHSPLVEQSKHRRLAARLLPTFFQAVRTGSSLRNTTRRIAPRHWTSTSFSRGTACLHFVIFQSRWVQSRDCRI